VPDQLKKSIVKHLKKHAAKGEWISQRELRNSIHAHSTPLFNQAAIALAMEGSVELFVAGPRRRRVIRLRKHSQPPTTTI
jgi:hypothetical protein